MIDPLSPLHPPGRRSSRPVRFLAWLGLTPWLLWNTGCGPSEPERPAPSPPSQTAPTAVAPAAAASFAPTNQPKEVALSALTNSFAEADATVQGKIQEAVRQLQEGQAREAVTQLKTVDAEGALTPEQQQAIREVIRAHRDVLRPQ